MKGLLTKNIQVGQTIIQNSIINKSKKCLKLKVIINYHLIYQIMFSKQKINFSLLKISKCKLNILLNVSKIIFFFIPQKNFLSKSIYHLLTYQVLLFYNFFLFYFLKALIWQSQLILNNTDINQSCYLSNQNKLNVAKLETDI